MNAPSPPAHWSPFHQANADYIHATFNVPGEHIHVIPCGVDTETFRPADPG